MDTSEWRGLFRRLRRQWVSTLAAMVVVGASVSLSGVTFELADAGVWRSLPYRDPADLVALTTMSDRGSARVSVPDFLAARDRVPEARVAAAGAFVPDVALTGFGEPRGLRSRVLSAGYFATLGVALVAGRDFNRSEERPGSGTAVILTDGLWQQLYGRKAGVVGESLMLNGRAHTIVGVLPPLRDYLGPVDLYIPMQFPPTLPRRLRLLEPVARVPFSSARAFHEALAAATAAPQDPDGRGHVVQAERLHEMLSAGARQRLILLFAAGLGLLIVAIANTSALVVSRARERRAEFALRRALGASRRAIVGVAAMDAAVMVGGGSVLGLILTAWAMPLAAAKWGADMVNGVSLGVRAVAWMAVMSCILLGVALSAIAKALDAPTGAASRVISRRPIGRLAVIGQLTISTGLVAVAVMLARHVGALATVAPGFQVASRYTSRISIPAARYPAPQDRARFWDTLLQRLGDDGVDAAITSELPLSGEDNPTAFVATTSGGDSLLAKVRSTSPRYLALMGVPLVEGRYLATSDGPTADWAIVVNLAMARILGMTGPALGQRLSFDFGEGPRLATVVGVVGNVRHTSLSRPVDPEVYFSVNQTPLTAYSLVLSAGGDPSRAREVLTSVLRTLDPGRPFAPLISYADVVARSFSAPRLDAQLMTTAAMAATVVAATGVYALLTLVVAGAAREWAIRLAVGASPARLRRTVIGQALVDLASGVVAGAGLAWVAASSSGLLTQGVALWDAWSVVVTAVAMAFAVGAAAFMPTLRIGRIEPAELLRA